MTAETSDRNGGVLEAPGAELDAEVACGDLANVVEDSRCIARCKEDEAKDDAYGSYVIVDGESGEPVGVGAADPEGDGKKKMRLVEDVEGEKGGDGECGKVNGRDREKVAAEERELEEEKEVDRECCMDNGYVVDGSVELFEQQQLRTEPQEPYKGMEEGGECSNASVGVHEEQDSEEEKKGGCSEGRRVDVNKVECQEEIGEKLVAEIVGLKEENVECVEENGECHEEFINELGEWKEENGELHGELMSELQGSKEGNRKLQESEGINVELHGSKEVNGEEENGAEERWEVLKVESHDSQESRDNCEFCKDHDVDSNMKFQEELQADLEAECHEKSRVACVESKESQELEENRDSSTELFNENGHRECKKESEILAESECYEKMRDTSEEVNIEDSKSCNQGSILADHSTEFLDDSKFKSKEIVEESRDIIKSTEIEEESRDSGDSHSETDQSKVFCDEDRELANEIQEICELKVDKVENNDVEVSAERKDDEITSNQKNLESAIDVEDDRESDIVAVETIEVRDEGNVIKNQLEVCDERNEVKSKVEVSDEGHEKNQVEASDEGHEVKNQVEASDEGHGVQSQVEVTDQLHELKSLVAVSEEVHELKNQVAVSDELHEPESQVEVSEELHEPESQVEVSEETHEPESQVEVSVEAHELNNQVEVSDEVQDLENQAVTEQVTMDADDREVEMKDKSIESREKERESKQEVQEGSSQEGSTTAASDSTKVDAEVGKRMPCFLIRIPRYINDKNNLEIDLAAKEVDKRTQHRDSFRDAIKLQKDACNECRDILEAARSEEKAARGAISAKRQEINTLQATINKMKDATSIDEIEEKVHRMEHKIEHETMSLKEEKQLIREIKQLKKDREELCAKTSAQSELQDTFDQKDDIEKRFKSLKQDLDSLRQEVSRAENVTKLAKQKFDAQYKILFELKEKFNGADVLRQEAYEHLVNLRKQSYEKNKYFRTYNEDKKTAWNYASTKNRDALQCHCSNQVEKIMELWNKDDEFRNDYVKNNMRSTLRRLSTLDGRSLAPDEKPLVLDFVEERMGNAIAVASDAEKENLAMPLVAAKMDPKPTPDAGQKTSLLKLEKRNKIDIAESALMAVPGRIDTEELEKDRIRAKEEEEMARKAAEEARKEQELARREEELRKEEAAVKLKEQRRLEEKVKAKEAEDRKKRNADKAQARAESKARREAELKEKEREKRMRKKEKKKVAAAASDGTSGSTEGESAPVANPSVPEATREFETREKPTTVVKRPVKPLPAAKQQTPRPLPLSLRNRSKRKMQPWMWAVTVALLFFTLFFVASFFELSVPRFSF